MKNSRVRIGRYLNAVNDGDDAVNRYHNEKECKKKMVKEKSNAVELKQIIEACEQLQKTCEAIVRMVTFLEVQKMCQPMFAEAMERIHCANKKKQHRRTKKEENNKGV